MPYRKSDGAFGMLPKKTAMDLEWTAAGRSAAPWTREADPPSHRFAEIDVPIPQAEGEILPWNKTRLT